MGSLSHQLETVELTLLGATVRAHESASVTWFTTQQQRVNKAPQVWWEEVADWDVQHNVLPVSRSQVMP